MPTYLDVLPDRLRLRVLLQPKASKDEVIGEHGDALKIRLKAPPVDGKANEALIRFLADLLQCSASQITLVRGHTDRRKVIEISQVTLEQWQQSTKLI